MASRIRYEVLLLTALLLVRVLVVPVIFLDFELRRDYIAQHLCENRNRPELHCNGQCYLAKQLKVTQEREQSEKSQQFGQYLFETPFVAALTTLSLSDLGGTESRTSLPPYRAFAPTTERAAPFHPPRA
jgi:hypothetical protein